MNIVLLKVGKQTYLVLVLAVCILTLALGFLISFPQTLAVISTDKQIPIYSVDNKDKKIALTFDCAWGDGDIPDIVATLEKEKVRASFFIVGQWAEKYPDKVLLLSKKGHDIANHSYSHLRMGLLEDVKAKSEIAKAGESLSKLTGQKIYLFRAPYGDYSNKVLSTAKSLGYYSIQWDVDSLDWKPGISREDILTRIQKRVKSGSILLFHNDTVHTAKILPSVISMLKSEGYHFVPVSELILRDDFIIDYEGKQRSVK